MDDKSNEITAIPELLKLLNVMGCIVTIDAMGCQTEIARTIIERQADYVLAVKKNQGQLHQDLEDWFAYADHVQFNRMKFSYHETTNKNHGRIEIRRCWAIADPVAFEYIRHYDGWAGLHTRVRVQRERRWGGQTQHETAYYISSLPADAQRLLACPRHHWSIQNSFHWVMDVTFREDDARLRTGDSPQNFAVLRQLALNILKQDTSNGSLKQKRFQAALDDQFLYHLLSQI